MNDRDVRIGSLECLEIFDEKLCRFTRCIEPAIRERDDITRRKRFRSFAHRIHPVSVIAERDTYLLCLRVDVVLLLRDDDGRSCSEPLNLPHLRHTHLINAICTVGKIRRDCKIERRVRHERACAYIAEFLPRLEGSTLDHRKPCLRCLYALYLALQVIEIDIALAALLKARIFQAVFLLDQCKCTKRLLIQRILCIWQRDLPKLCDCLRHLAK